MKTIDAVLTKKSKSTQLMSLMNVGEIAQVQDDEGDIVLKQRVEDSYIFLILNEVHNGCFSFYSNQGARDITVEILPPDTSIRLTLGV